MRQARRALIVSETARNQQPWWWADIDHSVLSCELDYRVALLKPGSPRQFLSGDLLSLFVKAARLLFQSRRAGYDYLFTFECGWMSIILASLQTVLGFRSPRHVILQFIMREPAPSIRSRLKYLFMRWCFRSVHLCVCSSRRESDYYRHAFGWPREKVAYVPFHTDPTFLRRQEATENGFVVSAGRTFRDYGTLLAAFEESTTPLVIVAPLASVAGLQIPPNVTMAHEIPLNELIELIARSTLVVLPLEDRAISIGQSVLLHSMALAKPVVVTRVNGTVDYVEHMETGLLVPPHDAVAIRNAVQLLLGDSGLRRRLGSAAQEQVKRRHLPRHYAEGVSMVLRSREQARH